MRKDQGKFETSSRKIEKKLRVNREEIGKERKEGGGVVTIGTQAKG